MRNIEASGVSLEARIYDAVYIAQRYTHLPEPQKPKFRLFGPAPSNSYEDVSTSNELQVSVERLFLDQRMTELESYYLALFAKLKVENSRSLECIAGQGRSADAKITQQRFQEIDKFRNKMITADKTFEFYGKVVAKYHPVAEGSVHDWFVRMRVAGTHVGEMLYSPLTYDVEEVVHTAIADVSGKRVPNLDLNRKELKGLLSLEDRRDPILDIL